MRVILQSREAPDGVIYRSLTIDREYEVIGIECDHYRLVNDHGEPILYDPTCFKITDPTESTYWLSEHGDEGERYSYPPGWGVPGFFEAWHDGVNVVRRAFAEQLLHWYPGISAGLKPDAREESRV